MAPGHRVAAARVRATLGELYLRAGHVAHAEEALGEALDAARGAHAAPLAATVSRTLGELRARQGNALEAAQWLGDAERIFTALGDVPELLHTVLTAAHVARDHGERPRAHALYERAAEEARTLEIAWIELAALAGSVLTNGGPLSPSSWRPWSRANELIASAPPDWWFAGRELVDAVTLQVALGAGHSGAAVGLFARALRRLDAMDPYAGAWLVAECAPTLEVAGLPAVRVARRQAAERARSLAFAPLVARLESE
jgi:tetratricopeptide (TPR) repeat protein